MVNKKMKNKELDELFRISKSTELKEQEIEELNQNFDSVFLHLFPNFIDDFNALLLPEAQIHPKEENRLTTDLRIFASSVWASRTPRKSLSSCTIASIRSITTVPASRTVPLATVRLLSGR